jgi:hypothetical protein
MPDERLTADTEAVGGGIMGAGLVAPCGICQRPSEVMATVPMCGQRPRYPLCYECLSDLSYCDYAEDVVPHA